MLDSLKLFRIIDKPVRQIIYKKANILENNRNKFEKVFEKIGNNVTLSYKNNGKRTFIRILFRGKHLRMIDLQQGYVSYTANRHVPADWNWHWSEDASIFDSSYDYNGPDREDIDKNDSEFIILRKICDRAVAIRNLH
jgi:hypothetical protein